MDARICRHFYKSYNSRSILNLLSFISSRFTFLLEDLDEHHKPLVLLNILILIIDNFFTTPFTTKFIEKNLEHIFKIVLKAQAFTSAIIIFLKGP